MKDFFRNLFGIRQRRKGLPVTPPPKVGASVIRNGARIKIVQPCDSELWDWLLLMGWRVNPVRNDRRTYLNLPKETINRLRIADAEQRGRILEELLEMAK
jgi:hypothetical protein